MVVVVVVLGSWCCSCARALTKDLRQCLLVSCVVVAVAVDVA